LRVCKVDNCDGKHKSRGFCGKHYARLRQHGDPNVVLSTGPEKKLSDFCGIDGCGKRTLSRNLCAMHYDRWLNGRELNLPPRPKRPKGHCMVRDSEGQKECISCHKWLPESSFYSVKGTMDKLTGSCKGCDRARMSKWRAENLYGLSKKEFAEILRSQAGGCAICETPIDFGNGIQIDHDHKCCPGVGSCGKCVRGLLCSGCNLGIGHLGDSPQRAMSAAQYLAKWEAERG
jgi:hypothetical protein